MRTKIRKLTGQDYNRAIELYAETCHKDRFYCKLFKTDDCYSDIKKFFSKDVWSTLQFGEAYGAFAGKQMIGLLLGFNVQQWYNSHEEEFNHVFNFDNSSAAGWYEVVNNYLHDVNKRAIYIYMIGTDEQFRRKGVASLLIKNVMDKLSKDYVIVSDASPNREAMSMWLKNGMKEIQLNGVVLLSSS